MPFMAFYWSGAFWAIHLAAWRLLARFSIIALGSELLVILRAVLL
jgi:hypothetical protein